MKGSAPALHVIGGMNLDAGQEEKGEEDELQKKIVKIIWNLYGFEWNPDPDADDDYSEDTIERKGKRKARRRLKMTKPSLSNKVH